MKEIKYSPDLWAKDRSGAVNEIQTAFAQLDMWVDKMIVE